MATQPSKRNPSADSWKPLVNWFRKDREREADRRATRSGPPPSPVGRKDVQGRTQDALRRQFQEKRQAESSNVAAASDRYTDRRDAARGTTVTRLTTGRGLNRDEQAAPITPEQWASFSPRQQQAMVFNQDLMSAVERDRAAAVTPTADQQKSYDELLVQTFGTKDKSAIPGLEYAPETLSLVANLGMKTGKDSKRRFADYLRLDAAMTMEEIAKLDQELPDRGFGAKLSTGDRRDILNKQHSAAQQRVANTLSAGQQMLNGLTGSQAIADATRMGGLGSGLGDEDREIYLTGLASKMVNGTPVGLGEAAGMLEQELVSQGKTPAQIDSIYNELIRETQARAQGGNWWAGEDVWSPDEVLSSLGALQVKAN